MFGRKDKNLTPLGGNVIAKNSYHCASILRLSHPVEKAHYTYVFVSASTFKMVPHIYTSTSVDCCRMCISVHILNESEIQMKNQITCLTKLSVP